MIQIEGLNKTYHTGFLMRPKKALSDIHLQVPQGKIYGFIGPNGAGKSTTIKVLTGLLNYDSGKVQVAGYSPRVVKSRARLGYCPEQPYFYDYLTGRELMSFYGRLVGLQGAELKKRIEESLDLVHANKDWIDRRLRTYSKGMMQRVGLAQSILSKPDLLILDEPMSGLDPMGRRDVREAILSLNKEGVTVFYSSHLLSDVESISDRIAMIVDGRIVREGSIDEVTTSCSIQYYIKTGESSSSLNLPKGVNASSHPGEWICEDAVARDLFIQFCLNAGISIERIDHHRPSLEDILTEEIARAES